MKPPAATTGPPGGAVPVGRAVLAVAAGAFGSLDSALNIAFPDLVAHFDLAVGDLQWVVVCFVLAYGGLLLAAGQLGDSLGHRRVLSIGAMVATAAMAGCALAPSYPLLLVGRVAQGVGTAMVMATAPALVTVGAGAARGRAVAVFQTAAAVGLSIGPIVGGPLVEWAGWRGVFWFRIPIGLALLAISLRVSEPRTATSPERPDRVGALLGAVALGAAVLALNVGQSLGWMHPVVLGLAAVTVAAAVAFARSGRRTEHPVLDVELFRSADFSVANVLNVLANGGMFVTWLLVPTLLIDHLGASLLAGGFVLAASPILTAVTSPIAGRISDRSGPWALLTVGLVLEAAGVTALAWARPGWSLVAVAALMAVVGAGLGLFAAPNMSIVMGAVPDSKQGVGGGLSLMTRTFGIVAGVAASSTLFDALEPDRGFDGAFTIVFSASGAVLALAALTAATRLPALRRGGSVAPRPAGTR